MFKHNSLSSDKISNGTLCVFVVMLKKPLFWDCAYLNGGSGSVVRGRCLLLLQIHRIFTVKLRLVMFNLFGTLYIFNALVSNYGL